MDSNSPLPPPPPSFPAEIWELIFGFCSLSELRAIRSVCRRWNKVIAGSPSLRRRLVVWFKRLELGDGYVPDGLPSQVTQTDFSDCKIWKIEDGWWIDFGRNLEAIALHSCIIRIPELVRMLRGCLKLKKFELWNVELISGTVDNVDFQLEAMEKLKIDHKSNFEEREKLLGYLRNVFPNLTSFSLNESDELCSSSDDNELVRFISTLQGSLKGFECTLNNNLLSQLIRMDQLQLKEAEFRIAYYGPGCDIELWTKFCSRQRLMEDLRLWGRERSPDEMFVTTTNMPNLKSLAAILRSSETIVPTFLKNLKNLSYVFLEIPYSTFELHTPLNETLTFLNLTRTTITHGLEFIINSPKIQSLFLSNCILNLCQVPASNVPKQSGLKHIRLCKFYASEEMLDYVLNGHPRLQIACFDSMHHMGLERIVSLLATSPRLSEILLICCAQFEDTTSGEEILQHYCNLTGKSSNVGILIG